MSDELNAVQDAAERLSGARAQGNEHDMWLNAFTLVQPSNETYQQIGKEIVDMLRLSMQRTKTDPLEPIGLVTVRIAAS